MSQFECVCATNVPVGELRVHRCLSSAIVLMCLCRLHLWLSFAIVLMCLCHLHLWEAAEWHHAWAASHTNRTNHT